MTYLYWLAMAPLTLTAAVFAWKYRDFRPALLTAVALVGFAWGLTRLLL